MSIQAQFNSMLSTIAGLKLGDKFVKGQKESIDLQEENIDLQKGMLFGNAPANSGTDDKKEAAQALGTTTKGAEQEMNEQASAYEQYRNSSDYQRDIAQQMAEEKARNTYIRESDIARHIRQNVPLRIQILKEMSQDKFISNTQAKRGAYRIENNQTIHGGKQ